MAVNLISHDGNVVYGIKEYVIDTPEDMKNVPFCAAGSTLFVISTKKIYMMNSNKEWVEI